MQTAIGVGNPLAIKKWATAVAIDVFRSIYFARFTGRSKSSIIQEKTELEKDAGDTLQFDLLVSLRGKPTYGDAVLKGREQPLKYRTDEVKIDQMRIAASAGGRMTRKRTLHDIRQNAKDNLTKFLREWLDEAHFVVLSGATGDNEDNKIDADDVAGFGGMDLIAPDSDHIMYAGAGAATSKATIQATHKMSRDLIERAINKAEMMTARGPENAQMNPVTVGGAEHYVLLSSPDQITDLRLETGTSGWLEIQKTAGADGNANPIFTGKEGMIAGVVLHKHRNTKRFKDYGAGANVHAARALFMGAQAGVIAYGAGGEGARVIWKEEKDDYDNVINIAGGLIVGLKKPRFGGRDFGVMAIDTAAKDPNAA